MREISYFTGYAQILRAGGAIPAVNRTEGGIRDYSEEDMGWVENAICMRNAGVPVEMVASYVKLCQQGTVPLPQDGIY